MQQALLILPILLGALFWAAYHYHKDRYLPEPPGNLLLCFALGLLAAALSQLMYVGLGTVGLRFDAVALAADSPPGLFAYAVLVIGPIEELAKLLPFMLVVLRFKAFDEPLDGIVYASFIALGYAATENVQYLAVFTPLESAARSFAGPVIHILFASIWAWWITVAFLGKRAWLWPAVAGFAIASGLHGLYDFIVLLAPTSALPVAAGLIVLLWIWRLRLLQRLQQAAKRESRRQV